jgi:single-stranded-DNA-specific exonuclease
VADSGGDRHEVVYFGDIKEINDYLGNHYSPEQVAQLYQGGGSIESPMKINMTYMPDINRYMGREKVQYVMQDYCV